MKNIIIAHDNEFSGEVGSNTILYFKDAFDLKTVIENLEDNPSVYLKLKSNACERVLTYYSWENITIEYDTLFKSVSLGSNNKKCTYLSDSQVDPKKDDVPFLPNLINYSLPPSKK